MSLKSISSFTSALAARFVFASLVLASKFNFVSLLSSGVLIKLLALGILCSTSIPFVWKSPLIARWVVPGILARSKY